MKINPIQTGLPLKTATQIEMIIQEFRTDDDVVMVKYILKDDNEYKLCDGYYQLDNSQYNAWCCDNTHIEDIVLAYLGLERYGYTPPIPIIEQPILTGATSGNTTNELYK